MLPKQFDKIPTYSMARRAQATRACIDNGGRHFDYLEVCALDQV
jgi:hypothetical protein